MLARTMRRRRAAVAMVVGAVLLGVAGCGGGGDGGGKPDVSGAPKQTGGTKQPGGTAVFAQRPGSVPDYIFPIVDGAHYSVTNIEQFQRLMWRPLYWYGDGDKPILNETLSLAEPPVYSDGNRKVSITLKDYDWSDGKPVTARDLVFVLNLIKANKATWAAYLPGYLPDNLKKVETEGDKTVVITMDKAYSPTWFTGNQLSQLMPLPQHAWDKTSADGAVGDYDTTAAGAKKVYGFLTEQTKNRRQYATNPLWQVVNGPWKLSEYRTDGYAAFVPNTAYSGPVKPTLEKFVQQPFTTESAELNALRSGDSITYGYVPLSEAAQANTLGQQGDYAIEEWQSWGINYFLYNFTNPTTGPIAKQPYFRQAVQSLVDQDGYIKNLLKGFANPGYGPVPIDPPSPYVTDAAKQNPYPFDPEKAASLLSDNGWTVKPDGVSTCSKPGTGAGECGPGIPSGAKLSFRLQYASGTVWVKQAMQSLKSSAAKVGLELKLSEAPFTTVISNAATPCKKTGPCGWDFANWGGGWLYGVNPVPSGDQIFLSSAGSNFGHYDDKTNDDNIAATTQQDGSDVFAAYHDHLAKDLPVVWMPQPVYQLSAIKTNLAGASPQNPILAFTPEAWYFTK
jgi:peptide/nickel transport system substrate-binding protein